MSFPREGVIIDVDNSGSLGNDALPDVRRLVTFERQSRTSIEIDILVKMTGFIPSFLLK